LGQDVPYICGAAAIVVPGYGPYAGGTTVHHYGTFSSGSYLYVFKHLN
jgi:hypothetical protein